MRSIVNIGGYAVFAALILSPSGVFAQSVEIFGENSHAKQCFNAAQTAARSRFTSSRDLENCDLALERGSLRKRDRAGTYVNRGIVLTTLSRYEDAYEDYHRAMELMPDMAEPYVGRGNIYFLAGQLQEAIADYSKALDMGLNREHVAFLNRGMAYEKLNRYDAAEGDYIRALDSLPDWKLAQQKLSMVRGKQAVNR